LKRIRAVKRVRKAGRGIFLSSPVASSSSAPTSAQGSRTAGDRKNQPSGSRPTAPHIAPMVV
jgi:hypothetical protein